MSLLLEIQASASDSSVPIQDLLRKCLILADRLGYEPLKEWARQELEGYPKDGDLPPYRVLAVADVQYDAVVGFYRLSGQTVARGVVPESAREEFFTARLHGPAAALQQMAESEGKLGSPVDPMTANYLVKEMYDEPEASSLGMTKIITRSQVMAVRVSERVSGLDGQQSRQRRVRFTSRARSQSSSLPGRSCCI
jgi:hypothetical protein